FHKQGSPVRIFAKSLPGFVRVVAGEIKKSYVRIFVLIDVGMWRLIIGNVIERRPGSLLAQLIADKSQAGAIKRRPDLFDIVVIDQVRLAHGEGIDGDSENTLQSAQAVVSDKERFYDVGPMTVTRGDRNFVFVFDDNAGIRAESAGDGLVDHIHSERLGAGVLHREFETSGDQDRDVG